MRGMFGGLGVGPAGDAERGRSPGGNMTDEQRGHRHDPLRWDPAAGVTARSVPAVDADDGQRWGSGLPPVGSRWEGLVP